jgi:hypothetical protein
LKAVAQVPRSLSHKPRQVDAAAGSVLNTFISLRSAEPIASFATKSFQGPGPHQHECSLLVEVTLGFTEFSFLGHGHPIAFLLKGREEAIQQSLQHIPPVAQTPFPLERIEVLNSGAGELQGQASP